MSTPSEWSGFAMRRYFYQLISVLFSPYMRQPCEDNWSLFAVGRNGYVRKSCQILRPAAYPTQLKRLFQNLF